MENNFQVRKGTDIPPHMKGPMHKIMRECPDIEQHVYGPDGYGDSSNWALEMSKTHEQKICICGFYCLWVEK